MNKKKILLIDDEREVVMILTEILRDRGYDVITASNAWQTLEKISEFRPHLIILDVMMPVVSGLQLLHQIRTISVFKTTPVILMSAVNPKVQKDDIIWNDFIKKPFNLDAVLSLIQKHLSLL